VLELPDGNDNPFRFWTGANLIWLGTNSNPSRGEAVGSSFGWIYDGVYKMEKLSFPVGI